MRIADIRELARLGRYEVDPHVVKHMVEEGFLQSHVLQAIARGRITERYADRQRCLVVGPAAGLPDGHTHLHVVCDLSQPSLLEFVTAYLPTAPWWEEPMRRAR